MKMCSQCYWIVKFSDNGEIYDVYYYLITYVSAYYDVYDDVWI